MFPFTKPLALTLATLSCALPALAQATPQAQDAALQYYRYQASYLQIYSRALDSQNGLAAAQAVEMLTDEFTQWGQRMAAQVNASAFRAAMQSAQADRARAQCDESIARIQQQSNERSHEGTNFIMLDSRFTKACAHFTRTLREFREAMGL